MTTSDHLLPEVRRAFLWGMAGLALIAATVTGLHSLDRKLLDSLFQSREMLRVSRHARLLVVDREAAIRGYLLYGTAESLAPEYAARSRLNAALDTMMTMTAGSRARRERVVAIRRAVGRWERGYLVPTLSGNRIAQERAADETAGRELHGGIRAALESLLNAEIRRFDRQKRFELLVSRISLATILIVIATVVGGLLRIKLRLVNSAELLIDQQNKLEDQATELEHQAEELEEQAIQLEQHAEEAQEAAAMLTTTNAELTRTIAQLKHSQDSVEVVTKDRAASESLLNAVLASSPMAIGLFDLSMQVTFANDAMLRLTGMTEGELLGKSPRQLFDETLAGDFERLLNSVITTGNAVLGVQQAGALVTQPSRIRHGLISYFPVSPSGGAIDSVGIVVMETTDRKELEEQLNQSRRMEAVGRLAGGVAHDFNNLLTAIKSYSELLLAEMESSNPQRSDVEEISKAADRAAGLTRQLLAFSRQQFLRPEQIDLNTVVAEKEGMLRRLAGSVDLRLRLNPVPCEVNADREEIERVIVNLVMNAADAMPNGGTITVETSRVQIDEHYAAERGIDPGLYALLAVGDTGVGMTKEVRERLFEPFFTTKEQGKGTGLGLSSTYGIVKQSRGHIWVYSEPGHGTIFRIYLPADDSTGPQPATIRQAPARQGETILLVEDDHVVRSVAGRILRREGYTVVDVENGRLALERFNAPGFVADLVLTDIMMPEMDGYELARRINEIRPATRILFTSGFSEDGMARESFLYPGAAFLEKPFTPQALLARTRATIDGDPPMASIS